MSIDILIYEELLDQQRQVTRVLNDLELIERNEKNPLAMINLHSLIFMKEFEAIRIERLMKIVEDNNGRCAD